MEPVLSTMTVPQRRDYVDILVDALPLYAASLLQRRGGLCGPAS